MIHRIKTWFGRLARAVFVRPRHWLSWVVGGAVALAMVIIVVPGTPSSWEIHSEEATPVLLGPIVTWMGGSGVFPKQPWPNGVTHYCHGWPLTHAVTAIGRGGFGGPRPPRTPPQPLSYPVNPWPISWSVGEAWPGSADASRWWIGRLFINTLVAFLIVYVATAATDLWLRRCGGLFRFRLIDALTLASVLAVVLGWYRWHAATQRFELQTLADIESKGSMVGPIAHGSPGWLQRLLGSNRVMTFCNHVKKISVSPEAMTALLWDRVARLPYLEILVFDGLPDASQLGLMVQHTPQLQELRIRPTREQVFVGTDPSKEPLTFHPVMAGDLRLEALADARRLETLSINFECLTIEQIEPLLGCPRLREVSLQGPAITAREYAEFCEIHRPRFRVEPGSSRFARRTPSPPGWETEWRAAMMKLSLLEPKATASMRWGWRWFERDEGEPLDLSGVNFEKRHAEVLLPVAGSISSLVVGHVSDAEALERLVSVCKGLRCFDGRECEATDRLIARLAELRALERVDVGQGQASRQAFHALLSQPELEELYIYSAHMTGTEVNALWDAADEADNGAWVEVYRDAEGNEPIQEWPAPTEDDPFAGGEDPF
ncbi:MAG: hypothetical protein AAF663_09840 [Planctomycetota bacterium]